MPSTTLLSWLHRRSPLIAEVAALPLFKFLGYLRLAIKAALASHSVPPYSRRRASLHQLQRHFRCNFRPSSYSSAVLDRCLQSSTKVSPYPFQPTS